MSRPAWWWHALVIGLASHAAVVWHLHRAVFACSRDAFDTAWHLASGRVIHETGRVPREDPWCYTSAGLDWVQMDWLSDWILYRSFLTLGFEGPAALASIAVVLTLALLLQTAREKGAGALATLLALAPVSWLLIALGDVRPRMATHLLLAFLVWLLARPDPERRLGWGRAAIVTGLLALWFQLHGEVLLGLALVGLDALEVAWRDGRRSRRAWLLLGAAALGAALGIALHPHGLAVPREMVGNSLASLGSPLYRRFGDTQPLDPVGVPALLLYGLAGVTLLGLARGGPRPGPRDAALALGLLLATLGAQRAIAPLLVLASPWCAAAIGGALGKGRVVEPLERRLAPGLAWLRLTLLVALAAWLVVWVPRRVVPSAPGELPSSGAWRVGTPTEAVAHLRATPGRIFHDYGVGGFLGWAFYPERRVFVDGRANLHAKGPALREYFQIAWLEPGWRERLDAWKVDLVLMQRDRPLPAALRQEGWRVLHEDPIYVLLARP